jgi:RHS repeat-associated protein
MKTLRASLFASVRLALFVLSSQSVQAQSDGYLSSNNLHGIVSGNTYQFGSIDNINLGTGAINIRIPLFSRKGRGITDEAVYFYSSKIWIASPMWDVVNPTQLDSLWWIPSDQLNAMIGTTPGGGVSYNEQEYDCTLSGNINLQEFVDTSFMYVTNDGATYQFPNRHIWNSDGSSPGNEHCPGVKLTQYNIMPSGEGVMQLDTTNIPNSIPIVTLKNGFRIMAYNVKEDTNGNLENANGDTLLRTGFKDSNGNSLSYTVHGSYVNASTTFPTTSCNAAPVHQFTNTVYEVSSLTLPNGWTYTFSYDPQFGDITKIALPSGGYIRYDYAIFPVDDPGPPNTFCKIDSRRIAHRYVSPDGNPQHEQTWTYSWVQGNFPTNTVADPLGNATVHTFTYLGNPNVGTVPHETTTQYKQNGTVIKTVSSTWASDSCGVQSQPNSNSLLGSAVNARITDTTTTLNDSGQVSDNQTDYDSYQPGSNECGTGTTSRMNPTEVREYDYGNGATGPLLRKTDFTYLHNSNSNYLNAHIWDRTTSKFIYDGSSNLKAQTTYEYDNYTAGLTASEAVQHDSAYNASANYTIRGNLTAASRWRNTDGAWLTTRNQYDDAGNVLSTTDPKGYTTSFSYADSWGNTTCVPTGGNAAAYSTKTTDPLTHTFKATYNSCIGTVASATDVNNRTTTVTYDSMSRTTLVKAPDNAQSAFSYVDTAPLSASSTGTVTSTLNLVNTILLDGLGRISQTQLNSDPSGVTYTDTTYDAVGRQSTVSNPYRTSNDPGPTNGITTTSYDPLGRVTQITPPDGNLSTGANTVKTSFFGNCTTVTDQAGKIRKSCIDGLGRLTQVFEPDSGNNLVNETDYTYDTLDNLLTVNQKGNDPNSGDWRTRTFAYNSLSQLTSATNPETGPSGSNGTVTYTYDNNGNLATKTFPQQNQTNLAVTITGYLCYDQENRLTGKAYSTSALTCPLSSPLASYSYDGANCLGLSTCYNTHHRTGMIDPAGSETWAYGDITNQGPTVVDQRTTNSVTKTATYQSNLDGSLAALTYPSGRVITYAPASSGTNTASRPISAVDSTGPINYATGTLYAPQGALSYVQNGAGFYSTLLFNDRLQPCWIYANTSSSGAPTTCTQSGVPNAAIMDFQFNFSLGTADNGNVSRITNRINTSRSITYLYDELNRIHDAVTDATSGQFCWGQLFGTQSGSTFTSGYDPWGNFKTITPDPSRPGCSVNTMARTINVYNKIVDTNFVYDADGNMTNDPSITATYQYDNENHLQSASTTLGSSAYLYDGDGKRVQKSNGRLYWYGIGSDALDETDLAGNTNNSSFNEYIFFGGKRIARRDFSNNVFYYFSDHLGTSREIVQAGQTSACYDADFYPFGGEAVVVTNTCSQNYKFTGKERDTESGLDNFGARYDSSSMGRFMSPDPLAGHTEDPQTLNRYAYVGNNPLNRTDPTGLDWYLGCATSDHSGCKQVQIDPNNKKSLTWVQTGKDGNATIITSDSIRAGQNTATVSENGVQINGKNQGIYFENPANDANHWADGKDHNQIDLAGSGALKNFNFHIDGNCSGTCRSSGEWTLNANSYGTIGDLLAQRGAFTNSGEDAVAFFGYGAHPYSTQYRFGGPLNSPHLSVPYDRPGTVLLDPRANVPRSGGFHVDSHSDWRHAIDVAQGKPE